MNSSQEISKKQITSVVPKSQTNIIYQTTNTVSRAFYAIQGFVSPFEGICRTIDIFKLLTPNYTFQNLLTFRLISQSMCEIMGFFLRSNVKISFWFSQLLSSSKLVEEKYSFAERENITIYIIRSVNDLLFLPYPNNEKENLNFILKIDNINEVEQLNEILLEDKNVSFGPIQGLCLKNVFIDSSNIKLISEFLFNLASSAASGLLGLSLGFIEANLIIPSGFKNLESIYIESLNHSTQITLPEDLSKLKSLTIEFIYSNATIKFPPCLMYLTTCVVGKLYTTLELPQLPNLKKLLIGGLCIPGELKGLGKVDDYGWLELPESLPCLEDLAINEIESYIPFYLNCKLDKLKTLFIGIIGSNVTIELQTPLDNLIKLSMQDLRSDTTLKLPDSLANLQIFSVHRVENNPNIQFPLLLNNFETIIINTLIGTINLSFKDLLLPNFKTLSITTIEQNTILQLPDALANIKELSIESLGINSALILPELLDNLTNLTINDIFTDARCDLSSSSLPNLQKLTLPQSNSKALIRLPKELDNLVSFHMNIVEGIILPTSLNSLIDFTIGMIKSKNYQFPSLPNLENLTIHNLQSQLILPEFENLKSLIIKNISKEGNIEFESFLNLETLILGENESSPNYLALSAPEHQHCSIASSDLYDSLALSIFSSSFNSFSFKSINSDLLCKMVCSLHFLENLSIDAITKGLSLILPRTIGDLKSFSINYLSPNVTLALPNALLSLKNLSIGNICEAIFKLPDFLQELEILTLEDINLEGIQYTPSQEAINFDNPLSKFLCSLPNLKNLGIQRISATTQLVLPHSLLNLQSLTIKKIEKNVNFTLTSSNSLKNLTTLTVQILEKHAKVTIAGEFNNLEKLILGHNETKLEHCETMQLHYLDSKSCLSFSVCSFDKLTTLVIGNLYTSLSLPNSLNKIQKLFIRHIACDHLEFPSTLDNLTSLEIGYVPNIDTQFVFPKFLPNLTSLTINGRKATLHLPSLTNTTKHFSIDAIESLEKNASRILQLINFSLIPSSQPS